MYAICESTISASQASPTAFSASPADHQRPLADPVGERAGGGGDRG